MGTPEAGHLQHLLAWSGKPLRPRLSLDFRAARRAALRHGVGRTRLTKTPRIQDNTSSGHAADIGAKPLPGTTFVKLHATLGLGLFQAAGATAVDVPQSVVVDGIGLGWMMYVLLIFVAVLLLVLLVGSRSAGYAAGYQHGYAAGLVGGDKKGDDRKTQRTVICHDVAVQGPVRYMRHYESPRFVPQVEDAWGANVGATWVYETTSTTVRRSP